MKCLNSERSGPRLFDSRPWTLGPFRVSLFFFIIIFGRLRRSMRCSSVGFLLLTFNHYILLSVTPVLLVPPPDFLHFHFILFRFVYFTLPLLDPRFTREISLRSRPDPPSFALRLELPPRSPFSFLLSSHLQHWPRPTFTYTSSPQSSPHTPLWTTELPPSCPSVLPAED